MRELNIDGLFELGHVIVIHGIHEYALERHGDVIISFKCESDSVKDVFKTLHDKLVDSIEETRKMIDDFVEDPDTTAEDEPMTDRESKQFECQKWALQVLK